MKYPNIKAAKISHSQIAKAFGYANVKSFRTSSAHQRHMEGVEIILGLIKDKISTGWELMGKFTNYPTKTTKKY